MIYLIVKIVVFRYKIVDIKKGNPVVRLDSLYFFSD